MQFPGFYGNDGLKQRLSHALSGGGFSHFYLLVGPEGSGKKTLARCLAAAMECTGSGDKPCGICPNCHKILDASHPDVITVDSDKATVPISVIRDMQTDAYIRPNEGKKKIYLIPRGQDMQAPAQNALLKLLEEPPEYCVFLLMTDNAEKILTTVRSRATQLTLFPLSDDLLRSRLTALHPDKDAGEVSSAIEKCGGYLGAAIQLLNEGETQADQQAAAISAAFASGDELELLNALAPLEKWSRPDFLQLLERLQLIFTRALAKKSGSNQAFSKVVTDLAAKCSRQKLYQAAEALTHGVSLLQANGSAGHCVGYLLATMRS